jgi:hypothetical protein
VSAGDPWVEGEAVLYRLHDVGYAIDLDRACEALAANVPERQRPVRGEAQAIRIPNPPVTVSLGAEPWTVAGMGEAELSARLFDFGVVSLRARFTPPRRMSWSEFLAFGEAVGFDRLGARFESPLRTLAERLRPAIERPEAATVSEEYVVFRITRLESETGERLKPEVLDDERIATLLIGESRPLTPAARGELLSPRFSYFEDDLTVLTWSTALVVEPVREDTDVQYVLEFANAQLLELRYYDSVLDLELPRIHQESVDARRGFHFLGRRYSRLLGALQNRVADATEAVERAENAFKVTDDVFLARIYGAALEIFRERVWRAGIDRKVEIVGKTYEMLNAESQARRTEMLELVIILLIALEIVLALRGH